MSDFVKITLIGGIADGKVYSIHPDMPVFEAGTTTGNRERYVVKKFVEDDHIYYLGVAEDHTRPVMATLLDRYAR